jgi:hypothetical protein
MTDVRFKFIVWSFEQYHQEMGEEIALGWLKPTLVQVITFK